MASGWIPFSLNGEVTRSGLTDLRGPAPKATDLNGDRLEELQWETWITSSRWNEVFAVTFLPSVIRAEYRGDHRLHLTFNDNSEKTIDFRQWLDGPVFEPLKKQSYFRRFFIAGGTVAWPNGADIAPETLFESEPSADQPTVAMPRSP